jgi:hypothetical protein
VEKTEVLGDGACATCLTRRYERKQSPSEEGTLTSSDFVYARLMTDLSLPDIYSAPSLNGCFLPKCYNSSMIRQSSDER